MLNETGGSARSNRFPFGLILFLANFLAVVLRAGSVLGLDSDYVLHEAYGRAILDAGGPRLVEDPTIYAGAWGAPILHEWASEGLFAMQSRLFGLWGPVWTMALVGAFVPWFLYRRTLARTSSFWPAMLAWVIAGAGVATGMLVRPHMFSVLCFLVGFELLEDWRESGGRGRPLLWLGVLVVAWTNLHGGGALFLLPVLLTTYAIANRRTRYAAVVPLFYFLTLLNPWGLALHRHLWRFAIGAAPRVAGDMGAPDFRTGTLYVLLTIIAVVAISLTGRRWPRNHAAALISAVTLVMACRSMRVLPYLAISVAYVVPQMFDAWLSDWRPALQARSRVLTSTSAERASIAVIVALFVLMPATRLFRQPQIAGRFVPTAAIDFLRAHPEIAKERGYSGYNQSGFLLHAGVVDRVYLHSLNANTPPALAEEYRILRSATAGWQDLFRRRGVHWALVEKGEPLAAALVRAGWRRTELGNGLMFLESGA